MRKKTCGTVHVPQVSYCLVGVFGLEPKASSSRTKRATNCAIPRRLIYNTIIGRPRQILFFMNHQNLHGLILHRSLHLVHDLESELLPVLRAVHPGKIHTLLPDLAHCFHEQHSAVYR